MLSCGFGIAGTRYQLLSFNEVGVHRATSTAAGVTHECDRNIAAGSGPRAARRDSVPAPPGRAGARLAAEGKRIPGYCLKYGVAVLRCSAWCRSGKRVATARCRRATTSIRLAGWTRSATRIRSACCPRPARPAGGRRWPRRWRSWASESARRRLGPGDAPEGQAGVHAADDPLREAVESTGQARRVPRRIDDSRGLFAENDGTIAAVLCHEYRHSRQRLPKTMIYALSFLLLPDGDPSIVENDALLYEQEAQPRHLRQVSGP